MVGLERRMADDRRRRTIDGQMTGLSGQDRRKAATNYIDNLNQFCAHALIDKQDVRTKDPLTSCTTTSA